MHAEDAYLFRHALVRDAAYQLQPPEVRAVLHWHAVEALAVGVAPADLPSIAAERADHARDARLHGLSNAGAPQAECSLLDEAIAFANLRDDLTGALALAARKAGLPGLDAPNRIQALVSHGQAAIALGRVPLAAESAAAALEIAHAGGDLAQVGRMLRATATVMRLLGKPEQADEAIARSIAMLEAAGDGNELANSLVGGALFAVASGRHQQARQLARRAIGTPEADRTVKSRALRAIGDSQVRTGEFEDALASYRDAIVMLGAGVAPHAIASPREGVANALIRLGRLEEADSILHELLQASIAAGRWPHASQVYSLMGESANAQFNWARAEHCFRESLRLAREYGTAVYVVFALSNLGGHLVLRDQLAEGETLLTEADALADATGEVGALPSLLRFQGELRAKQGRRDEALASFRRCLELSRRVGDNRYIAQIEERIAGLKSA